MIAIDRLISEQEFHDRQAAEREVSFVSGRAELVFANDDFLDHENWIGPLSPNSAI